MQLNKDELDLEADEVVVDIISSQPQELESRSEQEQQHQCPSSTIPSPKRKDGHETSLEALSSQVFKATKQRAPESSNDRVPSPRYCLSDVDMHMSPKQASQSQFLFEKTPSQIQLQHVIEAQLQFVPYDHGDLASDIISLYHNAIKCEVQDIYLMLSSMTKRKDSLDLSDYDDFDTWLDMFSRYLSWYLQFEETQLIPFIERMVVKARASYIHHHHHHHHGVHSQNHHGSSAVGSKLKLEQKTRNEKKHMVELHLEAVLQFLANLLQMEPSFESGNQLVMDPDLVIQLIHCVDAFIQVLLDYLFYEQAELVLILSSRCKLYPADKREFEDHVFQSLHELGVDGHLHFHTTIRSLHSLGASDMANVIQSRYLNQYSALSLKNAKVRKTFLMSRSLWSSKHNQIVAQFMNAWNQVSLSPRASIKSLERISSTENTINDPAMVLPR